MAVSQHVLVSRMLLTAALILSIGLLYRLFVLDSEDPYKCHALQSQGRWLGDDREGDGHARDMYRYWQPPGCMLHNYKSKEVEKCLKDKRVVFVGDSTTRQIFWASAKKLNQTKAVNACLNAVKHGNLKFTQGRARLDFVWDPFLNSSLLQKEMMEFNKPPLLDDLVPADRASEAAIILIGGGLWHARHMELDWLSNFQENINDLASYTRYKNESRRPSIIAPAQGQNLLLFAPIPSPDYLRLSPSRKATITQEKVMSMNEYLLRLSTKNGIEVLWSFPLMSWNRHSAYETSGLHVVENIASQQADIVLNMRCNGDLTLQRYPFDKTCCTDRPPIGFLQGALGLLVVIILGIGISRCFLRPGRPTKGDKVFRAIAIFAAGIGYCFAADRTWLFENMVKAPDQTLFFISSGSILLLGVLTVGESSSTKTHLFEKGDQHSQITSTFLNREQTEEWKGWMQLVILAYHYLGMSQVLWVYEVIRLLVAAYLFMTGFGHTLYFYTTNDFSLRRVSFVLLRLNMLAYALSLAMRTDWDFYYFPALSSLWFLIVYTTMRVRHRPGELPTVLILKILISAVLVTGIIRLPGILEHVLMVLKSVFKMNINVKEFRFRVTLDMYIVYVGMLTAILYLQISGSTTTSLGTQIRKHFSSYRTLAIVSSFIILPTFFILIQRSPDKYDYNWWQPTLSFLPILSFVVLRNSNRVLRTHHSRMFAWVGRFSLETFVLQYHIWLAGDTKGLLRLGLFGRGYGSGFWVVEEYGDRDWGRWVEGGTITVYFLWVSWAVSRAEGVVVGWIAGSSRRSSDARTADGAREVRGDAELLPKVEDGRALDGEGSKKGGAWWKVSTPGSELDERGLRWRVLVVLMVMWMLNLLYD